MQSTLDTIYEPLKFKVNIKEAFMHLMMCIFIFIVPTEVILLPVLLGFLYNYYTKSDFVGVLLVGIYAMCCKSDVIYFGYSITFVVLYLLDKKKAIRNPQVASISKTFSKLVMYLVIIYLIFLPIQGNFFSLPLFAITFLTPVFIMKYVLVKNITTKHVSAFLNKLLYICIAQSFIALFLQAIPTGISRILTVTTLGDTMSGTTNEANALSFLIFTGLMPFLISTFSSGRFKLTKSFIWIGMTLLFFLIIVYLNDAKTEVDAFVLASIFIYAIKKFFYESNFAIKILKFIGLILLLVIFQSVILTKILSVSKDYDDYITGENNAKVEYYMRAFDPNTRSWFEYIMGTGGGSNGSRVGNALASDVLYKDKNGLKLPGFIPPYSSKFTRHYLAKLYTADYAKTVKDRSALLGNPFNSVCAFFVEFGIIGTLILIVFYWKMFSTMSKRSDYISITALILLIANVIIAFVDQGFERPTMMHLMFLFVGLSLKNLQVEKNNDNNEVQYDLNGNGYIPADVENQPLINN